MKIKCADPDCYNACEYVYHVMYCDRHYFRKIVIEVLKVTLGKYLSGNVDLIDKEIKCFIERLERKLEEERLLNLHEEEYDPKT